MPKPITIDQINGMSQEEVQALNAKLGRQVVFQFGARMAFKWAVIFGTLYAWKKYLNATTPAQTETTDVGD